MGKVRKYSIEDLDRLITSIKSGFNLKDEEIAVQLGYNEGYISQTRARGFVPDKFMEALKRGFAKSNNDIAKNIPVKPQPIQISPNSDYKDKYLALLESENLRLKNELSVSLVELHENLLVGKAMAATNQSMLIELLAKQRKASIDQVVLDANKLFDEFYRNMKAKDILPDGDR